MTKTLIGESLILYGLKLIYFDLLVLKTSRVHCSERQDHNGSSQNQHFSTRVLYIVVPASLLLKFFFNFDMYHVVL